MSKGGVAQDGVLLLQPDGVSLSWRVLECVGVGFGGVVVAAVVDVAFCPRRRCLFFTLLDLVPPGREVVSCFRPEVYTSRCAIRLV